jgi:hypothetical protein
MREVCRIKTEAFASAWSRWQHVRPRVRQDTELTDEEKRNYSLILVGGPEANRVTQELQDKLPFRIDGKSIEIDGESWPAEDAMVSAIYPNPTAPQRYMLFVAGTSATGLACWNPVLWAEPFGFGNVNCDWFIKDNRPFTVPAGHLTTASYLAYGTFDRAWRRSDATSFAGDPSRSAAPKLPRPAAFGSGKTLGNQANKLPAHLTGRYELFPGVSFRISNGEGFGLFEAPGNVTGHLVKYSENEYLILENGGLLRFSSGTSSGVTAMLHSEGQDLQIHRVEGL